MSLVDVDSWTTEYDACERLNHVILTHLTQREKQQRLSPEYNKLTASIQMGLKQFVTELHQLKERLNANESEGVITFEENERRQRQISTLNMSLHELQLKFTNTNRSDRAALLKQSTGANSNWQIADGGGDAFTTPTGNNVMDVETLKQRQIDVLEDQNRGLETLSQTISRQRALASQLGQEVEDQNDILDNLANTMERVDARVNVETGNIGDVNRRDSTWCYWTIIIALFVAIVLVAVL